MDPALISLVPTGSIAGVLVIVIFYLLRQNHQDRSQYADAIAAQAKAATDDREEFRHEVASLRAELKESREEAEAERVAKWRAEGDAVAAAASAAAYKRELDTIRGGATV